MNTDINGCSTCEKGEERYKRINNCKKTISDDARKHKIKEGNHGN